jgi:hypothetical protein
MTKLEIITQLVAAEATTRQYGIRYMGEDNVRTAAKLADWILFVAAEDEEKKDD